MVSSAKLALFAFLQDMRSISLGRNLKAFILRCMLFWPRILRSLMKVWSWYFQTSARDEKKTKKDTGGPSFVGTMGKREECVVVCASLDFGGVGGRTDFDISTPPTMTHDSQGPPEDSASEVSIQVEQPFRRGTTESMHFSRPRLPSLYGLTQSSLTSWVSIQVEQPSRPASPETTESMHSTSRPQLPSPDDLTQKFPPSHQPSTESVNSLSVSLDLREHSPWMSEGHIGAQDSKERIQDPLTSQPTQTPQTTFPEPSTSRKLTKISTTDDVTQRTPSVPQSHSSSYAPSPHGPHLAIQPPAHPTPVTWTHSRAQFTRGSSRSRSRSSSLFRRRSSHSQSRSPSPHRPITPVTWTHSRATGRQFTRGSSRSQSRSPSPHRPITPVSGLNSPTKAESPAINIPTRPAINEHPQSPPNDSISEVLIQLEDPSRFFGSPLSEDTRSIYRQPQLRPVTPSEVRLSSLQDPVRPMHSDQVSRYVKKGDVLREKSSFLLQRAEVVLPHSRQFHNSGDWIPVTHPGGALYFYHERMRIFTDVYMYDPSLREEIYKSSEELEKKRSDLEYSGISFPTANYDLVLDIVETKDKTSVYQYYYVDHNNRTLFWLDEYEMKPLLDGILGVKEPGHIKRRLESLYWVHWSLYPTGYKKRNFPDDVSDELLGILLSSSIDSLTCNVSTAPYSVADMQTMCDIINKVKVLGPENPHAICSVARILSICVYWRFAHFHGQKTSRQNRYKSIYKGSGRKHTKPFQLISVILFFTPDAHMRELKKVWADESIFEGVWKNFMQKLVSEWTDFVLYSTVMLTANVGFLAIQGVIVIPSNGRWIKASPAQIASSISLVYSIGSIITGLLLIRRHREMVAQDPRTAYDYLDRMAKPLFYLEPLAVIFSLTYALLMWSVCGFFVALLLFTFKNATANIRISVGAASGFVTILIIWCIVAFWDSGIDSESEGDELISILSED